MYKYRALAQVLPMIFIGILPVRSSELLGNYLLVYATNPNFIYGTNNIRRKNH